MLKNIIKRLFSDSFIYALGPTLLTAVGFVLIPIYTGYLSLNEYGTLELVLAIAAFLSPWIDGGLTAAFWKFISGENAYEKGVVLFNCLVSQIIMCAALIVLTNFAVVFFSDSHVIRLFNLYILSLVARTLLQTIYLEFQSAHKAGIYVAVSASVAIFVAVANIILVVYYRLGVVGIILGNVIGTWAACIVFFPFYWKAFKPLLDFQMLKELYGYGLPLVIANLSYLLLSTSDRFFISKFANVSDLGLFAYGYKFSSILMTFVITPFFLGFNPIRWELFALIDAKIIFSKLYSIILIGMVSAYFLFVSVGIILGTFLGRNPEFHAGLRVTPLMAFSSLLYGLYYYRGMGLLFEKKTHIISLIILGASFAGLLLNFLLIPLFSYMGAGISSVIAYLLIFILCSWQSQKYYPIQINKKLEALGIGLAGLLCAVSWGTEKFLTLLQVGFLAATLGVFFTGIGLYYYKQEIKYFLDRWLIRSVPENLKN